MRRSWKKALSLLLALALLLSFTACSKQESGTNAATTGEKSDKTTTSGKTDPTDGDKTDPTDGGNKPTDGDKADPTDVGKPTEPEVDPTEPEVDPTEPEVDPTEPEVEPTEPTNPGGDGEHTHSYEAVVTEPTCTEQGYTTHTCACGDSYVDSYVDALGHDLAPATCTTPKICLRCEAIEGEALGHAYENGSCSRCGEIDPDYLASASEGLAFELNEDGESYCMTGIGECTDTDVVIPSLYNDLPVTSIGDYAFRYCSSLTSITIPDGVTSIGEFAFRGCSSLTSITIPDSVTSIGDYAFSWCTYLTSITIPDSVTSIGRSAFLGCYSLTSITIPDSVTSIGRSAFSGTAYYKDEANWTDGVLYIGNHLIKAKDSLSGAYTIKEGTKCIADQAFYKCSRLTSITIPDGVTSIGSSAFSYCSSVTSITIPDGVTSIGDYAFSDCSSLTSITVAEGNSVYHSAGNCLIETATKTLIAGCQNSVIPDDGSVTSIGDYAFEYCSSLTSITIPDSVTSIGNSAFEDCSSLTSITIPDSVTSIGYGAFYGTAYYNDEANWTDGVLYIGNHLIKAKDSLSGAYTIKEGTKCIADYAFDDHFNPCSSLTSITIPDSVTSIGNYAFRYCISLTSITIPDGVTDIGDAAFSGCSNLTSITVAEGNSVYHSAGNCLIETATKTLIAGCQNSVIPDDGSVTSIGDYAFEYCSSLTSITIPDGVTSIGNYAFHYCISLTSITIPDSVTSIGDYAFWGCYSLTSITIPDSVTSIGESAFRYCSSLTSVTIGNGVTSIGDWAFYGCSLTSITIPDSVTDIGDAAFSGCSNLTSITVAEGNSVYHSAGNCLIETATKTLIAGCQNSVIPDDGSVTSIGDYAFSGCSSLTSITIPDSVTSIGLAAFHDCRNLTSITIPFVGATKDGTWNTHFGYIFGASSYSGNGNYVSSSLKTVIITGETSIGDGAFLGCYSLTSITIPDSVTSIGRSAFSGTAYYKDEANWTDGVLYIGNHLIKAKDSLSGAYTIKEGTKCIADQAFYKCSRLTSITIPDGVTSIGSSAFSYCSSVTSITIPDGVTSIGDYAFSDCSSLTSITIGSGVTSIGENAFEYCSNLTDINFEGTMEQWRAIGKGSWWDDDTGDYTVHCSDGDIEE